MARRLHTLCSHRSAAAVITCLIVSIALLSLPAQQQTQISRVTTITVLAPLQSLLSFIPSFFGLREENRHLRQELILLQLQNAILKESAYENGRLRKMLGLRDRSNYRHIPAEVIGKNTNYGKNTIVIDVGSKGGVNRYMAVAAPEGVVGRVIEVGPWSAVVQLLSDKDSKVSALVQRSRTQGSISWRQEHGLDMRLPLRSDIRVGDAIVTSGMGGTFPPGLRIGHVEQLQLDDTGLFKQATIRPRVDLNRIEEVFVIMPGTDSDQNKPEERVRLDERFSLKSEQSGTR